jgi:hypothetical protein
MAPLSAKAKRPLLDLKPNYQSLRRISNPIVQKPRDGTDVDNNLTILQLTVFYLEVTI